MKLLGLGGDSVAAPSDTLPSYWGALALGADGFIASVHLTRDGFPVCAPPGGIVRDRDEAVSVKDLDLASFLECDAGVGFVSRLYDEHGALVAIGDEKPWARRRGWAGPIRYSTLDSMLLRLGRCADPMFHLHAGGAGAHAASAALLDRLERFGLTRRASVIADAGLAGGLAERVAVFLVADPGAGVDWQLERARTLGCIGLALPANMVPSTQIESGHLLVLPDPGDSLGLPADAPALAARSDVAGIVSSSVDLLRVAIHGRGLVLHEQFTGPELDNSLWATGHSRNNDDTALTIDDGLRIAMAGENYSGAAAITEFPIVGDFDAQVQFSVTNPGPGTTFELAAIHIDAGYQRPNLSFDVHGAPPYASTERDEADGFRIGWNNGGAVTRWHRDKPESSNLYNNYGADVGYGRGDRTGGALRLSRSGEVFAAFFQDKANPGWVLSGTAVVPALGRSVFLRLAAKHWPKRGGPAPVNTVVFSDFDLYQF